MVFFFGIMGLCTKKIYLFFFTPSYLQNLAVQIFIRTFTSKSLSYLGNYIFLHALSLHGDEGKQHVGLPKSCVSPYICAVDGFSH